VCREYKGGQQVGQEESEKSGISGVSADVYVKVLWQCGNIR